LEYWILEFGLIPQASPTEVLVHHHRNGKEHAKTSLAISKLCLV